MIQVLVEVERFGWVGRSVKLLNGHFWYIFRLSPCSAQAAFVSDAQEMLQRRFSHYHHGRAPNKGTHHRSRLNVLTPEDKQHPI